MRNVFYMPSIKKHFIPPFHISESGLSVNNVARTHCEEDVSHESHSIVALEGLLTPHNTKTGLDILIFFST